MSDAGSDDTALNGWSVFFTELTNFLTEAKWQFGIANQNYTEYVMQRMDIAFSTCSYIRSNLINSPELQQFLVEINELYSTLRYIYRQWSLYEEYLDSGAVSGAHLVAYRVGVNTNCEPGRPRFDINKDQLEYLFSLGFKWTKVAALLGVSRMTIYRYTYKDKHGIYCIIDRRRVEYGLVDDPQAHISEADLTSLLEDIRRETPFAGVSLLYGSVRAHGIKVTREEVRSSPKSLDPLGSSLRSLSGATPRQPYSVPGPNSLWHIGILYILI